MIAAFIIFFCCGVICTSIVAKFFLDIGIAGPDRRSFIAGSYAYGDAYRTSHSDVDIVVWTDKDTLDILSNYAEPYDIPVHSCRIKTGNFDLIIVSDKKHFDHWRRTTDKLRKPLPASRQEALKAARRADQMIGDDWGW